MRTRTKIGMAVAAIAMGLISPAAKAVIINGGFENGDLTGYTSVGDAAALGSNYNPATGSFIGGISNITSNAQSPFSSSLATTIVGSLDSAAGLAAGTLEAPGINAKSGSVISQTFFATAGDTVTFSYNFITEEPVASTNQDRGFYTLRAPGSSTGVLVNLATSASATSAIAVSSSQSGLSDTVTDTGRQTGNTAAAGIPIALTGLYTISFGVVNVNDNTSPSALLIDNLAGATGNASGVPLPLAAFIAPLGLAVAGRYSKKFRRQQA